jgi:hypothetical protein
LDNGADVNLQTFEELKPIDLIESEKYELKSLFENYARKQGFKCFSKKAASSTASTSTALRNELNRKSNEALFVSCK